MAFGATLPLERLPCPANCTYNLARLQQAGADPQPSRPYVKHSTAS